MVYPWMINVYAAIQMRGTLTNRLRSSGKRQQYRPLLLSYLLGTNCWRKKGTH
jgi:hypothetical protein